MLRIETKTKLSPEAAIKKAIEFFGEDGEGLTVKEQTPTFARFEVAGGAVEVLACAEGKGSSVEMTTQEWEIQVNKFAEKLARAH
jgi:hypothetical protein